MKTDAIVSFGVSGSSDFIELSKIESFEDGSGYVSVIRISSGAFVCTGKEFYFDDLPRFLDTLKRCYSDVCGSVELRQCHEHEFVRFEFTKRGHVVVSGILLDYYPLTRKFEFGMELDQSYLPPFIAALESVIAELKSGRG